MKYHSVVDSDSTLSQIDIDFVQNSHHNHFFKFLKKIDIQDVSTKLDVWGTRIEIHLKKNSCSHYQALD